MRSGAVTLADVSACVDTLRIVCAKCGRLSQSHVERLIYDFGPNETVSGWTARTTADCPRRRTANLADPCAARLVDLPTSAWTEGGTGLAPMARAASGR